MDSRREEPDILGVIVTHFTARIKTSYYQAECWETPWSLWSRRPIWSLRWGGRGHTSTKLNLPAFKVTHGFYFCYTCTKRLRVSSLKTFCKFHYNSFLKNPKHGRRCPYLYRQSIRCVYTGRGWSGVCPRWLYSTEGTYRRRRGSLACSLFLHMDLFQLLIWLSGTG